MRRYCLFGTRGKRVVACGIACALLPFTNPLNAEPPKADGVYGRLDGDVGLEPGLGVSYSRNSPMPALDFGASYLSTLGLRVRYSDSKFLMNASEHDRSVVSVDLEVRPLFLARWSEGLETGPAWRDLTIDSFLLGLGVFWDYDRALIRLRRGAELVTGLGFPVFAKNDGPWLRATAALRLEEGPGFTFTSHGAYALTLGWKFPVNCGIHDDTD